jgi:hypothetical protein
VHIRPLVLAGALGMLTMAPSAASPPININAPLPAKNCIKALKFCESTVVVGNLLFVDGNGDAASKLSNFSLNVIQFPSSGGNLLTEAIVNFNLENVTIDQDTDVEYMHIKFLDKRGNYLPDVITVGIPRKGSNCGKQPNLIASAVPLDDIFKKGAFKYEITQEKITGVILVC